MPEIRSFAEANKVLAKYVPATKKITGKNMTVGRMLGLLERVGNPHKRLRVVHVAGTSGKTSTAYYIASLFMQSGKKVGLTVSPHVDSVAERAQINLKSLSEAVYCAKLSEFMDLIGDSQPSYFELLIAFAFWVFDSEKVDYAVVEVGMGGLHDSTNILDGADKVCVITDVGIDHTNILGKDLSSIAYQKAGIIKDHNAVFCHRQAKQIMDEIEKSSVVHHAQLHVIEAESSYKTQFKLPLFQQRNFELAEETVRFVAQRDDFRFPEYGNLQLAARTVIPARMETVEYQNKTLILDGAHNPQKLEALAASMKEAFAGKKIAVLMGIVSGKDTNLQDVMKEVSKISDKIIFTSYEADQDMPRPSVDPEDLQNAAIKLGIRDTKIVPNPETAFGELMRCPEDVLLVCGSFYLLNYIRPLIFNS